MCMYTKKILMGDMIFFKVEYELTLTDSEEDNNGNDGEQMKYLTRRIGM